MMAPDLGHRFASWRGLKLRNPPPGSLQAVGRKLFLSYCQFLPSPEALVVSVIIMVVVVEVVDIDLAHFEMAREDCILDEQANTPTVSVKCKKPMRPLQKIDNRQTVAGSQLLDVMDVSRTLDCVGLGRLHRAVKFGQPGCSKRGNVRSAQ